MQLFIDIAFAAVGAILAVGCSYKMFQIFQLSSYKIKGVKDWFKISNFDYIVRYFALAFLSFIGMFVFIGCFESRGDVKYVGIIFYLLFSGLFIFSAVKEQKKTPLKLTYRVFRVIIVSLILYFLLNYGLIRLGRFCSASYSLMAISLFLIPFIIALAHLLILPFEILNNNGFKKRAMRALAENPELIKIGITGSYGKTTAKHILTEMLRTKYQVCSSPKSYNTPMGISKVINNELKPTDEVFIAEMGARNVGDIKELTKMVQPNYGMITAVGKQHLETFGSIENIINTKYELIENLTAGGLAIFNGDSLPCIEMHGRCTTAKYLTGSKDLQNANASYSNVEVSGKGTTFDITIDGKTVPIQTVLLGKHIPGLILMCAGIAYLLRVELDIIAKVCGEMKAVPHRLELINRSSDMIIIDDAYNSNTEGSKNALEILSKFDAVKIIVTPGLVELGAEEKELNIAMGGHIGKYSDYAFLLGARAEYLKSGAISEGMAEERIFIVDTLESAVSKIGEIEGKKVVLFENDLPDNY